MSIYGSIQPRELCEIPERDYHTGQIIEGHPTMMIDIAVALSWHDCIRMSLIRSSDQELLLTIDEANLLIDTLARAIQTVTR